MLNCQDSSGIKCFNRHDCGETPGKTHLNSLLQLIIYGACPILFLEQTPLKPQGSIILDLFYSEELFLALDALYELSGCGVGTLSSDSVRLQRESRHASGLETILIIEKVPSPFLKGQKPATGHALNKTQILSHLRSLGSSDLTLIMSGLKMPAKTYPVSFKAVPSGGIYQLLPHIPVGSGGVPLHFNRMMASLVDPFRQEILHSDEWMDWCTDLIQVAKLQGGPGSSQWMIHDLMRHSRSTDFRKMLEGLIVKDRKLVGEHLGQWAENQSQLSQWIVYGYFQSLIGKQEVSSSLQSALRHAVASALRPSTHHTPQGEWILHLAQEQ
jgi:hypothetical protein